MEDKCIDGSVKESHVFFMLKYKLVSALKWQP